MGLAPPDPRSLSLWIAIELLIRQPHAAVERHIGPQVLRGGKALLASECDDVGLITAVAADGAAADEDRALVERRAAGEEDNAVLIGDVAGIVEVAARVKGVETHHA